VGREPATGRPSFAPGYRPDVADAEGLWYTLRPRIAYAWLERDYPKTATRFTFEQSG